MKKKCFFSLLFLLSLVATSFAAPVANIDVFVAKTGSDTYGDGSENSPYHTLAHAVLRASSGQTVGLADGIYKENLIKVPQGVSISSISQDASKVIIRPTDRLGIGQPFFQLSSPNPGSSGNQSVSYITLDGDVDGGGNAGRGVFVRNRNDVRIHHCTIKDFGRVTYGGGIFIESTQDGKQCRLRDYWPHDPGPPGDDSNFLTTPHPWPGNPVERFEFDHNAVISCGLDWDYDVPTPGRGYGQLNFWNVKDSNIHHNLLDNSKIGDHCIRGLGSCTALLWNVDFYSNDMRMKRRAHTHNFGFETWGHRGGCEVYNNTFDNIALSITYGKETEVRNNTIIHHPYLNGACRSLGVEFTFQSYGKIDGNYIEGSHPTAISVGNAGLVNFWMTLNDVVISNNICVGASQFGIGVTAFEAKSIFDGFKIYNNVVAKGNDDSRLIGTGIKLDASDGSTLKNTEVANNIVIGGGWYAARTLIRDGSTYSNNTIKNNLFYGNQHNSWLRDSAQNTVVLDPKFVGGTGADAYKLRSSDSPAIGAGVPVPLTYDFAGNPFYKSHPSLGAYEYNETVISPPENVKVTPIL